MFNKTTSRNFGNIQSFLGQTYGNTKRFLSSFDKVYRTGKQIYEIAEPVLSTLAPDTTKEINKHLVRGIGTYENLRSQVMNTNDDAINSINNIIGKAKSKNIKIPLI